MFLLRHYFLLKVKLKLSSVDFMYELQRSKSERKLEKRTVGMLQRFKREYIKLNTKGYIPGRKMEYSLAFGLVDQDLVSTPGRIKDFYLLQTVHRDIWRLATLTAVSGGGGGGLAVRV